MGRKSTDNYAVKMSSSGNYRSYGQYQQTSAQADTFTAEMRDRQARGKDPYHDSEDSSDASHWAGGRRHRSKDESYTVAAQRRHAAQVLETPELLMMNAQRENDSIPATRLRYTRMLCGVEEQQYQAASRTSSNSPSSKKKSTSSSSHHHGHHHHHGGSSRTGTPSKRSGSDRAR